MKKNAPEKNNISPTTVRRFLIITFLVSGTVPVKQEASFLFSQFSQGLFNEFQMRALIIVKEKREETGDTRRIFAGLLCESASKHTFKKKIKGTFSGATISKIETKKSIGAWSFALLNEDKELILCFGEDIFYLKGAAGAFQQHRAVLPVFSSKKTKTTARKPPKKVETPLNKERVNHLVVRLLKGAYAFLFSYFPRFWRRRLMNFIAFFLGVLLLALLLTLIYFLLDYALEGFELDLEISPERAKRYNDLLEKYLGFPRIFKEPPPPPPVPWYYPSELYSYGKGVVCRAVDWICFDSMKCGLSYLRKCILEHFSR